MSQQIEAVCRSLQRREEGLKSRDCGVCTSSYGWSTHWLVKLETRSHWNTGTNLLRMHSCQRRCSPTWRFIVPFLPADFLFHKSVSCCCCCSGEDNECWHCVGDERRCRHLYAVSRQGRWRQSFSDRRRINLNLITRLPWSRAAPHCFSGCTSSALHSNKTAPLLWAQLNAMLKIHYYCF